MIKWIFSMIQMITSGKTNTISIQAHLREWITIVSIMAVKMKKTKKTNLSQRNSQIYYEGEEERQTFQQGQIGRREQYTEIRAMISEKHTKPHLLPHPVTNIPWDSRGVGDGLWPIPKSLSRKDLWMGNKTSKKGFSASKELTIS